MDSGQQFTVCDEDVMETRTKSKVMCIKSYTIVQILFKSALQQSRLHTLDRSGFFFHHSMVDEHGLMSTKKIAGNVHIENHNHFFPQVSVMQNL